MGPGPVPFGHGVAGEAAVYRVGVPRLAGAGDRRARRHRAQLGPAAGGGRQSSRQRRQPCRHRDGLSGGQGPARGRARLRHQGVRRACARVLPDVPDSCASALCGCHCCHRLHIQVAAHRAEPRHRAADRHAVLLRRGALGHPDVVHHLHPAGVQDAGLPVQRSGTQPITAAGRYWSVVARWCWRCSRSASCRCPMRR